MVIITKKQALEALDLLSDCELMDEWIKVANRIEDYIEQSSQKIINLECEIVKLKTENDLINQDVFAINKALSFNSNVMPNAEFILTKINELQITADRYNARRIKASKGIPILFDSYDTVSDLMLNVLNKMPENKYD